MKPLAQITSFLVLLLISSASVAGPNDPRIQLPDFEYLGAFRLPSGSFGGSSFAYGGEALAYNPDNDSLFIVGHDHQQWVAEINIPNIVKSSSLNNLATATVRQNFRDASEGRLQQQNDGNGTKTGGLLVYNGRLYGSIYRFYDASQNRQSVSHYSRPLNLSATGDVVGLARISAPETGFVSGYMTHVPSSWRASYGAPALTGNCCLSIIDRTSWGPAAFAFDPAQVGTANPVPSKPMVYYNSSNRLDGYEATSIYFNGSTSIKGVLFPEGASSVLFFGRQGIGPFCYGSGSQCNDPENPYQGTHAYPYRTQIWAYDANELLRVSNGQAQPWSVRPYAIWEFNTPFNNNMPGGVAYDAANGRMFLALQFADGERPIIVVYRVGSGTEVAPPAPPTNVIVDP